MSGIDLSNAAFPHMSVREGFICGAPTRLARVSYTGELGFEVNVPADFGESVLEAIWAEGEKVDAVLYGLETLHVLRAEKGFIVVGQETDGTVTPDDVGMGKMVAFSKPDFIGKRSLTLARPEARRPQAARRPVCRSTRPSSWTRVRKSSPTRRRRRERRRSAMSRPPI